MHTHWRSPILGLCAAIAGALLLLTGCDNGISKEEPVQGIHHSPTVTLSQLTGQFTAFFKDAAISLNIECANDGHADIEMGADYEYVWGILFEVAPNTFVAHFSEIGEGSLVMILVADDADTLRWIIRSINGDSRYFEREEEIVFRRR